MRHIYILVLLFLTGSRLMAQCPAVLTVNVQSVTHASCPDAGSVVLGGNGVGNSEVTYKVISGPSHVGMEQSSNIFHSLSAGTYQFAAICDAQTVYTTVTVNNLYSPINSGFTVNTSNICTNYTPGGTITVSGVSGGKAPYSYSFIKNNNANYDDALSVYVATNTYNAVTWGTYQVRVKDACGAFVTKTVEVQRSNNPAFFGDANVSFENVACDSAAIWFWMHDDAGTGVLVSDYSKLRFRIFEKNPSDCLPGALIKTVELFPGDDQVLIIPRRDLFIEVTTPCGDVRTSCYNYPDDDKMVTRWLPLVEGCGTVVNPYSLTIKHQYNSFATTPLIVKLFNNNTNQLLQSVNTWDNWGCCTFPGLSMSNTYRIEVLDACGKGDTVVIAPPTGAIGIAPPGSGSVIDKECTFQNGTTTAKLQLTGLIPNITTTVITITSGPDNIGQTSTINPYDGLFYFYHLTPNATYGFSINTGCSVTNINFTVTVPEWDIVEFWLSPSVEQQCGGTGTIEANIHYSGWGNYRSELWLGGARVDYNNSGVYTNMAPGTYTILAIAEQDWCDGRKSDTLTASVTVLPSGTLPSVSRKIGYACESGGSPSTSGFAYIEVSGFGPFKYEIKRISPSPEAAYTTLATNAPSSYLITNLNAYAVYSLLVTDNCGNSTLSEIVVGALGTVSFDLTYQPCVGSPYLLRAPFVPGATYSWVKNAAPTVVLSTSRELFFATYNIAYNGLYTCTIVYPGGCLQRQLNADLSSIYCGAVLPVSFTTISYKQNTDCSNTINWSVADKTAARFDIERSYNNTTFQTIGTMYNTEGVYDSLFNFSFSDKQPLPGTSYYRVKASYPSGNKYSATIKTVNNCGLTDWYVSVSPNPADNTSELRVISMERTIASIHIRTVAGQLVKSVNTNIAKGDNKVTLNLAGLSSGIYIITVSDENKTNSLKLYKK